MKNLLKLFLTSLLCVFFGVFGAEAGLAQVVPTDGLDQSATYFYNNRDSQLQKVEVSKTNGFNVLVPLDISKIDPMKLPEVLGDGTFQQGIFDFAQVTPATPGTSQRFEFTGPPTVDTIYSVVAGKPKEGVCPIEINETQIAFFADTTLVNAQGKIEETKGKKLADERAKTLFDDGYLVYVTSNAEVQRNTAQKLAEIKCQEVNGITEKATVDFSNIFYLLPPNLQHLSRKYPKNLLSRGFSINLR